MSLLNAIKLKLGQSITIANNFLFDASANDGTLKVERESGQDILTVKSTGEVSHTLMPQVGNSPIVESGSNSNGTWTKYADGTMICTHTLLGPISMGLYITGLYQGVSTWPFPNTFVGLPVVSGVGVDQNSVGWLSGGNITTTSVGMVYFSKTATVTGSNIPVMAIGRWKA